MEVRTLFGRFVWRGIASVTSQSILPEVRGRPKQEGKDQASDTYKWLPCTTGPHTLQWRPIRDTSLRSWDGWRASHGKSNKKKRRIDKQDKDSTYRSPMKHDTLLISIGKIDSSKRRERAIQRLRGRKVMYQSHTEGVRTQPGRTRFSLHNRAAFCLREKLRRDLPENLIFNIMYTSIIKLYAVCFWIRGNQRYSKASYISARNKSWLYCSLSHV